MRIQHNIMAMNAYRNYGINTNALSKNLEKLSSGYRINRAGDDAAGLAISEKMRAQITGLNAAQKNVKDGISLVKTAEGAMQEIQDMLNRMSYLATQSANGTYDDSVDRANLQKEVDALKSEIDRIADSANFNGISLLDGSLSGTGKAGNVDLGSKWNDLASGAGMTLIGDGTPVKNAQKGKYELDLSKASWTASDTGATIQIEIGGITATVTATGPNVTITGKELANEFMKEAAKNNNEIELDGKKFKVSWDSNGKITFTGKDTSDFDTPKAPSLGATFTAANMKVDDSQNDPGTDNATGGNQGWVMGLSELERPVDASAQLAGQMKIDLNSIIANIKDGFTLKIGNSTYTFAIGKDSKYAGKEGVIDMTDISETDTNRDKILARRLSGAANGNGEAYVEAKGDDGFIYITEKIGGLDRSEWDVVGDEIEKGKDATWENDDGESFVRWGIADPTTMKDASAAAGGLQLQIGDTSDSYNQLNVIVGDMHSAALGIAGLNIGTAADAANAIQTIRDAINNVSSVRGDLGAVQNRLEHTQNNLSVMAENIQDAESTIRDTDVAEEMMAYVKNNILIQSAQAMLAQANQIPQGVLQLLG